MNTNQIRNSYRDSSIAGASSIGLVIALYDVLVNDLRGAAEALRRDDIEGRCAHLHHAALVLGQLEDWVNLDSGEELAKNLKTFYDYLRSRMLMASLQKSAALLEQDIELVLQVRAAWQEKDASATLRSDGSGASGNDVTPRRGDGTHIAFSQSA